MLRSIMKCFVGVAVLFAGAPRLGAAESTRVEVKMHNGRPMTFVDGKPRTLPGYCPTVIIKPWFLEQMAGFYPHKMGVYIIQPPAYPTDPHGMRFWKGDRITSEPVTDDPLTRKDRFPSIDAMVDRIAAADPGAMIMVRFGIREPASWLKLHPQECFIDEDGKVIPVPSRASDLYWSMAAKYSAAIIKHCEARPWARRLIGYANLHRNEGTHEPLFRHRLFDHNPVMVKRWRAFLKAKYKTDERLRQAHGNPTLTLRTVKVPRDKLQGRTEAVTNMPYWQLPKDNQPLRDYLLLQRDIFHQRFKQMTEAMRAGAPGKKRLFLYDALKQTMIGWNLGSFFRVASQDTSSYPEMMAGSGHMNVAPLFSTPGFDGLLTPHDYQAREVGGVYEPEGIVDSTVLRGKFFYCEMDTRSYAKRWRKEPRRWGLAIDDREFAAVTWRNLATSLTRGFESYWADNFGINFDKAPLQKIIGRQVEVIRESVDWPHETVPGIAMILDDAAVLETNGTGAFFNSAIQMEWKMGLARCGVPFRIYLLEDLTLDNFPKHRVFYFPNLFKVTDERLALLKKKVFRDGNVVVWGPGSGITDGKTLGPAPAERLTGFKFNMIARNFPRRTLISNFTHPITRDLDADTVIGDTRSYGPILFPADGTPLGLAWTMCGQREAGLAVKTFGKGVKGKGPGDYAAVFTTSVPLPAKLWRGMARWAGANVYCETNDVLMASKHIVALHSLKSGPKVIHLPSTCDVIDVITGKPFAKNTNEIRFELNGPETRVFRLEYRK